MKLRRPPSWRHAIHFCGWDRDCQSVHAPWYLYLHFLGRPDGQSVRLDLTPPWVWRSIQRWMDGLEWQSTRGPR